MLVRLSIIGAVSAILMLATMLSAQELEALLTPALPYLVPLFGAYRPRRTSGLPPQARRRASICKKATQESGAAKCKNVAAITEFWLVLFSARRRERWRERLPPPFCLGFAIYCLRGTRWPARRD
jgi:hypothetical protein